MALKWRPCATRLFPEPVGVLRMTCGTFTKIDEQLIVLFMVMSEVIKEAVTEIEGLTPGDAPPLNKMDKVLGAYEAMRMRSPQLMQDEINDQLRIFDASKVFSEIKFLKEEVIDGESQRMVQAILIMCGHKRKDLLKWAQVQTILKNPGMLHEKMLELNITTTIISVTAVEASIASAPPPTSRRHVDTARGDTLKAGAMAMLEDLPSYPLGHPQPLLQAWLGS